MDDMDNPNEPLIQKLRVLIRFSVRSLAVLMTLVILWGVVDVAWEIYEKLRTPPVMLMNISDILATFGAFMAVLIAIEIFINITIYLRDDVIHVKIVMATALMAIARKVIILDFKVGGAKLYVCYSRSGICHEHRILSGGQTYRYPRGIAQRCGPVF